MNDDSSGRPAVPEGPAPAPSREPQAPRWPRPEPSGETRIPADATGRPVGPSPLNDGPRPARHAGAEPRDRPLESEAPGPRWSGASSRAAPSDAASERSLDEDAEPPTRAIDRQIRTVVEWVAVAIGALAVALIIKTVLLQAFYIPSGSMEATLMRGDRVLVNKLSYDLHDVNRGDVVVFGKPPGEGGDIDDLIKRVIALPGETVMFQDGSIFIDGLLLEEPYIEVGVPSLAKTPIPHCVNSPTADSCTVPEDRVFVMGDNREESRDSRFFGPIESDTIVGRAFLKVWPLSDVGFL